MSRVIFVNLSETEVTASCAAEKVGISALERLPAGGVRLVCMSSDGAHRMTRKLKGEAHHLRRGPAGLPAADDALVN